MKRYAELIENYKKRRIKNLLDNNLIVDSDYRGEVIVALHNHSTNDVGITHGERIAQLIVIPYISVDMNVVDELSDTARASSGFGSTGQF